MSDISIPGVSSKYNTGKMIDAIMEAEKVPLNRMENRQETFNRQKKVWNEVNRKLSSLQENARGLYSFDNPFREYVANSTSPEIISASADRNAAKGIEKISVQQVASNDAFRSRPLSSDFSINAGEYAFKIGEQEVEFSFDGGDSEDFVRRLNRRGKGLIEARLIRDTPETNILLIESTKTGADNQLTFLKDSQAMGESTGLLARVSTGERNIAINSDTASSIESSRLRGEFQLQDGNLVVPPGTSAQIQVSPPVQPEKSLQLVLEVQVRELPQDEYQVPSPPPGPQLPDAGGVELEGIEVQNAPGEVETPPWEPPPKPETVETLQVLSINEAHELPELTATEEPQKLTIPLSDLGAAVRSIDIRNRNTGRRISVNQAQIENPKARGEFQPQFPVSTAQNAQLTVNGIPIERNNNNIDDVIPGVTLTPQMASDRTVEINVEPDKEAIKNGLIQFLGSYNQTLTEVNILTSNRESVIEEIGYFEDADREAAREKLGMFSGDSSFMQLKNRLQRIASASYETSAGRELSMLSQMGISTNASGGAGSVSRSKLRGYLEVDESQLDEAIDQHLPAIKELFGQDTDGDLVVDSGIAVEISNFVNAYTRNNGLIDTRTSSIDRQIDETEDEINDFKRRLEDKETDLKRKYGRMEGALGDLEDSRRSIEGLQQRNSQ
ncbi:MAG: flagellar filament capping protein FliD [Spirochaetia bacterium]|nr:flagellar filament capping protein FliD [Spirochaetia bacterium]